MTVLVAYDHSRPARKAVQHAVEEHGEETIVLLQVIEAADGSFEAGINLLQERFRAAPEDVVREVADDVLELLENTDGEYEIETAIGKPAREIVRYAEEHDVDRILIGSHGRDGVSRILLGSVAETVVRRAPVTVTVVR